MRALRRDYTRPDYARYACDGRKAKGVCSQKVTFGAERLENCVSDLFLERLRSEPVAISANSRSWGHRRLR